MTVPTSKPTNNGPCVGSVPAVDGIFFLRRQATGGGEQRNQEQEATDQLRQTERQVVPGCVDIDAGKRAAIVARAADIRVEISLNPCAPQLLKFAVAAPGGFQ